KINEKDNLQLSYSRRINRPNFFTLIPFTDFTDSLNLRRGNPDLTPEFTNSYELTYQNIFEKGDNVLISAYYKSASDLITTYQFSEFDPSLQREVIIQTFENSNNSYAYGMEFTTRNTFAKIFTLVSNLNVYNARVDASNIQEGLINDQFTWFLKENLQVSLPKGFTLQINGQYQSRTAFDINSNQGRFRGFRRQATNTAQGYTIPVWFVDVSIRKSIMKRKGTITASMSDVFGTRQTGAFADTEFFIQETWRLRQPQVVRVNFFYRFGKADASLFKRKNTNSGSDGGELMN
ncbi:MAG: outer membrane beta-barrel family protein, partial [Bacteroidota bacterium]